MTTMENNTTALTIPGPMALASDNWLTRRETALVRAAKTREVADADALDEATEAAAQCQRLTKLLEGERKKLTAPLDDAKKQIMATEKKLTAGLIDEYTRLKRLAGEYATRIAKEHEEAERRRREAEAAAAMEAERVAELFGAEAVEEIQQPPLAAPYMPPAPKAIAGRMVTVWDYEITDEYQLARQFLSPDPAKIRAFIASVKAEGIEPEAIAEAGIKFTKSVRVDAR
jgi:hypothetical protein